jgi:hypothetical protein
VRLRPQPAEHPVPGEVGIGDREDARLVLDQQRLPGQARHVEPGLVIGGKDRDRARDDPDPERGHTIEVERGRGVDRPVLHGASLLPSGQ